MASAIQVGSDVRAAFRSAQVQALNALKLVADDYNQDCNAVATLIALKAADVDFGGADAATVLQILKIAGNASANRQALQNKGETKADSIAADLLKMVS